MRREALWRDGRILWPPSRSTRPPFMAVRHRLKLALITQPGATMRGAGAPAGAAQEAGVRAASEAAAHAAAMQDIAPELERLRAKAVAKSRDLLMARAGLRADSESPDPLKLS